MKRQIIFQFALSLALLLASTVSQAVGVETLPQGVRSPQLRYGSLNGLDQAYDNDGKLWRLGDLHSVNFDAATLARVNPDATVLIRALDVFGSQNLGRDINYGTLLVETKPHIDYQAAVFAYGLTNNWTVALAVPVIHYQNKVRLSSQSGNIDFYRSQLQNQSEALDRALNLNLVTEAQKSIASKGYQPRTDRDEKFVGDVQLVSLYHFDLRKIPSLIKTSFILPTGPRDNPDDLLATNVFHRREIETVFALGLALAPRLMLKPLTSITIPLPESEQKRVPLDENDTLPDQSQTEEVRRIRGLSAGLGTEVEYLFGQRWSLEGSYLAKFKQKDRYDGARGGRYDLLEEKTDSQSGEVRLALNYSTVQAYKAAQSAIPGTISLAWSDTVTGKNTIRQQLNEITVMMFF